VAWIQYDPETGQASPVYVSTAYETHGHQRRTDPSTRLERTPLTRDQSDERRLVIENNAAWCSAETARREWLPNIAASKTPLKGAAEFVAPS
jgi:hypothetical protein